MFRRPTFDASRFMITCSYCGRENEDGQELCAGCGSDLGPVMHHSKFDGVLDPITPARRCSCGGVMRYYTPTPQSSTFFRPYRYRYCCRLCGARALVPPWDKRRVLVAIAVIGFGAILWLCFSKTAAEFDRSWWNTRLVVVAIVFVSVGLAAGHLALVGAWNRRRYPIIEEVSEDSPQRRGQSNAAGRS
jgi:hypothetical protein